MHTSNSHCQLIKHLVDTVCKHGTGQSYDILSEEEEEEEEEVGGAGRGRGGGGGG